MPFIEAPTTFYIGRAYDPAARKVTDDVVYYDSRDLTTHAVILGMTGSGKSGLGITLLEEAALDGIPSIAIDPKGDVANIMLMFPDLLPEDFRPWINPEEAEREGVTPEEYAARVAAEWRQGLRNWDIMPDRIAWLKDVADFAIYTPGSDSGLPVSILESLKSPEGDWYGHEEELREQISGVVTALLALIGIRAQPVKDREHVLLSNIFEYAWKNGRDLSLESLIVWVQRPPFRKLGVFDVDAVFPEKDRFSLAMRLNNLVAAPRFQSWLSGEPLDVRSLLYTSDGRPRVSIFYTSHLSDEERMFIITLLLENVLAWLRTLSGTTSLRALVYFDEVFGYFPPYPHSPPTKEPLLRLLKQARAYGVGLILATQNPGDLDYKGLSNAGTWFIGKLQAERDKDRVLEGMGDVAGAGTGLDVGDLDRMISSLAPRVFVLHNVHDDQCPLLMHTRWTMAYLRGPLTRRQVRELMAVRREMPTPPPDLPELPGETPIDEVPLPPPPPTLPDFPELGPEAGVESPKGFSDVLPAIPSSIHQYFLPTGLTLQMSIANWERENNVKASKLGEAHLAYLPVLLAQARVRFQDRKASVNVSRQIAYHVPNVERGATIRWDEYRGPVVSPSSVASEPLEEAWFGEPSSGLLDPVTLKRLREDLIDHIYHTMSITLLFNPTLKVYGTPGGSRREFRVKVQALARERRDAEVDRVTARYEEKLDRLEERLRRELQELEADRKELDDRKREELFTTGEAVMSLLRGRTTYTLSRMSRTRRLTRRAKEDVRESEETIAALEEEIEETRREMERALRAVREKWAAVAAEVQEVVITPFRKDIFLELYGVGWLPHWYVILDGQRVMLPAFGRF